MTSKRQRGQPSGSKEPVPSKGKGKGKKSSDNPHGIQFRDDMQEARYHSLATRSIVPTRYMDEPTLLTLGLLEDVNLLFGNVGWTQFVRMKHFTYERITLEFLSSVNAYVLNGEHSPDNHPLNLITFRLFNTEHSISLSQFNAIYGFPYGGERRIHKDFSARNFWNLLTTSDTYDSSSLKSSKMRNPCFRYVHRVMSNTLFGRGDSGGVVRQTELLFIWNVLHPDYHLDAGSHLISHMVKVGKASAGKIVIGGLITPIAEALRYRTSVLQIVRGSTRLDIEACLAMKMVVKEGECYFLVLPGTSETHPLPDQEHTNIRNRRNWNFPGGPRPEPLQEEIPEAPPASPTHPHFAPPHHPLSGSYAALQAEVAAQRAQRMDWTTPSTTSKTWHPRCITGTSNNILANVLLHLIFKPPITAPTPVVGSSQFQHVSTSLTQMSKGKEHQEIRKPTVETNDQPQSTPVELQASAGSNISAGTEDMSSDFAVIAIAQPQSPITSQVFTPPPSVGSSFEPKNQIDSQTEVSEGKKHHEIQNRAVETKDQPQSISMEFDAPAGSNVNTLTECMCSDSDAIVIAPPQGPMVSQVCTPPSAVGSSFEPKNQLFLLSEMSEGKDCNEIQNHTVDSNDQPPSISVELHNLAGSNIITKTEDANSDSAAIEIAPLSFASSQDVGSSLEPQTEHVLHTEIEPQVSKAIAYYERQHPTKETDVQLLPSVLMEFDAPSGVSFNTQTADGTSKDETKMGVLATELGITQLSQVSVCLKCGDKGFLETLVFCNNCQVYALHRYCLDGPVIFTDNVTWFCEDCEANEVDRFS